MRADAAAPLFAALGDATRLRIVERLGADGPASITRLGARADVTRQAIRKHLDVLERAGLVRGRRDGREHVWQLEPRRLAAAHAYLDLVAAHWDASLARLKAHVEDGSR